MTKTGDKRTRNSKRARPGNRANRETKMNPKKETWTGEKMNVLAPRHKNSHKGEGKDQLLEDYKRGKKKRGGGKRRGNIRNSKGERKIQGGIKSIFKLAVFGKPGRRGGRYRGRETGPGSRGAFKPPVVKRAGEGREVLGRPKGLSRNKSGEGATRK